MQESCSRAQGQVLVSWGFQVSQWLVWGKAGDSSSLPPRKQTIGAVVTVLSFADAWMATVFEYLVDLPEESMSFKGSMASRISLNFRFTMPETAVNSKAAASDPFKRILNRMVEFGADGPPVSKMSPAVRLQTKAPVFGLLKFMTQKYAGTFCQKGHATG